MQLQQGGKEALLRRQDSYIASGRDLSVKIQNHVLTLHLCKNRVKLGVIHHARGRVGGNACWVALDTGDAALLGFDDGLRGHGLVEVQRHEEVHIGFNGLQALLVVERAVDSCHWRHQVGLNLSFQSHE